MKKDEEETKSIKCKVNIARPTRQGLALTKVDIVRPAKLGLVLTKVDQLLSTRI